MDEVYNNPEATGSFSSVDRLHQAYRDVRPSTRRKDVQNYLQTSPTYTIYMQKPGRFSRRMFRAGRPGAILCADVAYMTGLSEDNDNIRFLLVVMDLFSKFLWVRTLTSLKSQNVIDKFESIFNDSVYQTTKICTDEGIEFTNKVIQKYFTARNISTYYTYNKLIKASPVERVIKTIKIRIGKYLHAKKTFRYIDDLESLVYGYNVTPHSALFGATPYDMYLMDNEKNFKPSWNVAIKRGVQK